MQTLKYVGPFDAVEIVGVGVVTRGEPFEVDAAVADSLLEQQGNYEPAKKRAANTNTGQES